MTASKLSLNLHKSQLEIFTHPSRMKLLVCGRRFGKSRLLLTTAITKCLSFKGEIDPASPPVVAIVMPTLKMAKRNHWKPLLNILENSPFVSSINKTDCSITFKGNKPDLILRGADDKAEGLRGLKLYWIGCDEFQGFPALQQAWDEVIRPALADTPGSTALVQGTPKGKSHPFYQFYLNTLNDPDWEFFHYETKDNPFVPRKEIKKAEAELPPRVYDQEFRAKWTVFEGQVFDQLQDRHVLDIFPAQFDAVYLGLDHGSANPAIAVIGKLDSRYYLPEFWTNPHPGQSVTVEEICAQVAALAQKYNAYRIFSPDDRPDLVISLRNYGKRHQIPALQRAIVVKRNNPGPSARADILNSLFFQDRLYINRQAENEFRSYRRESDNGTVLEKIASGQEDHCIDASAYALTNLENNLLAA